MRVIKLTKDTVGGNVPMSLHEIVGYAVQSI